MLVLSRKLGETIVIHDDMEVTLAAVVPISFEGDVIEVGSREKFTLRATLKIKAKKFLGEQTDEVDVELGDMSSVKFRVSGVELIITLLHSSLRNARIGVTAPPDWPVRRSELPTGTAERKPRNGKRGKS